MIAPWLQDLLFRERNWRATLRRLSSEWAQRRDRAGSLVEVGRALEHVEPDRRFAVLAYQNAGPEAASGRALDLALELGWWSAVVPLATQERSATGSIEALVWEGRALIDQREHERAERLIPNAPGDPRVAALRAELGGGSVKALAEWQASAKVLTGSEAAEAYLITGRLARALGHPDWEYWLELATQADPSHLGAVSQLWEQGLGDEDSKRLLSFLRKRLEIFDSRGDVAAWCDAVRHTAMRLWFGEPEGRHRGLARRLLTAALDRAYSDGLERVPGHLAMWAILDEGAAADHTRPELLPLIIAGLEGTLPVHDRVWLAALGAEICAAETNLSAAHAYAAVVAAQAPLHPAVRAWFAGAIAEPVPEDDQLDSFRDALLQLEVEACQELQIEEIAPIDESMDLELAAPGFSTISMRPVLLDEPGGPVVPLVVTQVRAPGAAEEPSPAGDEPPPMMDERDARDVAPAAAAASDEVAASSTGIPEATPVAPPLGEAVASGSGSFPVWAPAAWSREERPAPVVVSVGFHGVDGAWEEPSPSIQARRRATEMGPLPPRPPASAPAPVSAAAASVLARLGRSKRGPTRRPPVAAAAPAPEAAAIAAAPGTAALAPGAAAVGATVAPALETEHRAPSAGTKRVGAQLKAPPLGSPKPLIPATALRALTSAGPPKPLPKPPPPPQARPRAHRVTVSMDLRLLIAGREVLMQSRDISSTGFFAVTTHELPLGEVVDCELRVPAGGLVEQTFRAQVRAVRRNEIGYGFEFVAPSSLLVAALNDLARA